MENSAQYSKAEERAKILLKLKENMEAFLESDPNNDEFEDEEIEVQIQDYDGWLKGATNPSKRDKYQKGLNILIERKSLIERKIQMTPNLRDQLIELERQFAAKGIIISL